MPVKERSQEEILLRENIRKAIKVVLDRRSKESEQERLEEQTLRKVIRGMIAEAKEEQVYDSTGQNDLSDYMKTNAPTIIQDYMKLQSNDAEKLSFMAVLKFAIINLFQDLDVKQGRLGVDKLVETLNNLSEDIKVDIEDEFDGDPLQEPEDPEDTDEGIRFARELGFEMPEKLDYRGLQQALKAFNSSIKNQLEDAYNNYGPGQSEDANEFKSMFWPTLKDKLMIAGSLTSATNPDDLISSTAQAEETIANEPGMADMEAPDIPEIPEEEQEEEVVGLEEFVDLDELLSNL
tara:strand:+ start:1229 stop:2104 length:876 start_codon:yes stop_codon:yes gene_type:complete